MKRAADEIRRFATKFKGFLEAADAMAAVGDLEQFAQEARGRRSLEEAGCREAQGRLALIEGKINEGKSEIERAGKKGEAIVQSAHAMSAEILEKAKAAANAVISSSIADVDRCKKDLLGLKDEVVSVQKEVDHKKAELAALGEKIAALRKQAAAFAGT